MKLLLITYFHTASNITPKSSQILVVNLPLNSSTVSSVSKHSGMLGCRGTAIVPYSERDSFSIPNF